MKAGVLGSPISHSLSPLIFKFMASQLNIPFNYEAIEVEEIAAKELIKKTKKEFIGFNITLPLKEVLMSVPDFVSNEAKALGALNVLHFCEGQIRGYNTDVIGIQKTFEKNKFVVKKKRCLIIGAGGSAKAMAYVLGNLEASEVIIYNRSERGKNLVDQFKILFPSTSWSFKNFIDDKIGVLDLVVNSTPVGMTNEKNKNESDSSFFNFLDSLKFNKLALAFDLIYTPQKTLFLKKAEGLNLQAVGGLGMLIDQAIASLKIFITESKVEVEIEKNLRDKLDVLLKGVLKLKENPSPIYLTGFMGVGKTKVGQELAKLTGRKFLDIDKLIERSSGMTISEIFKTKGELFFRELESEVLINVSSNTLSVVSLGGGAIINSENLKIIKSSGTLVYLSALEGTLLKRISTEDLKIRPIFESLSQSEDSEKGKKISELLKMRLGHYKEADIEIETDDLTVENVVFKLLMEIGKKI